MRRWAALRALLAPVTVLAALTALAAGAAPAAADAADDLVAEGQELAKRGEYSRAIDAFKRADARRPRALHACLIALSYTRRELWAQAEVALAACHDRAAAADPLPPWVDALDRTLSEKLAAAPVAPIAITVEPAAPGTMISISSFSPDETFTPRVVHLAPGTYTITAVIPGRGRAERTIVVAGRAPQAVTLRLAPRAAPSRLPWLAIGAGGLLAAGGLAVDLLAVQPSRSRLADAAAALDFGAWDAERGSFARRRAIAVGLLAGGLVAAGAGVVWRLASPRREIGVAIGPGGVALVGAL